MGLRKSVSLFLSLVLLATASTTFAQKLCLQSTVNKATLKVTNKSVVASKCPKGYTALADTSQFRGPQGPAGILNLNACRFATTVCSHSAGANTCALNCNVGEFVLQFHEATASDFCSISGSSASPFNVYYSNGVGAGVTVFSAAECSYSTRINMVCCPTA